MRCHLSRLSVDCAIFCRASWTLFSPKSRWPGVGGGADGVDGMGLGDGDQPDVFRRSPGAAGRVRDAFANARQPFGNVFVHVTDLLGP